MFKTLFIANRGEIAPKMANPIGHASNTTLDLLLRLLALINGLAGVGGGIYFISLGFPSDQAKYTACEGLFNKGQDQSWLQCVNNFEAVSSSLAGQWWAIGLGVVLGAVTIAAILWTLAELLPRQLPEGSDEKIVI